MPCERTHMPGDPWEYGFTVPECDPWQDDGEGG
jgi:hypothetical protein